MASHGGGVILNIASDLGMIAPDQRIYRDPDAVEERQPVKPVTYSVVKHGLIGLTRYLATYWPDKGVRANALCPGGIYNSQPDDFVERLTNLIPMGRMADKDDYTGAVLFMLSDASRYMNGSVVTIDGGRTCW
jgi:NAD(P)-dependent dehydrogenase (short-subunit alcohol dehydrogenase family)